MSAGTYGSFSGFSVKTYIVYSGYLESNEYSWHIFYKINANIILTAVISN